MPHLHNPSRQTKGAITLTFAAVVLLSGLWSLWYSPATPYDTRKNEQLTNLEFVLGPNGTTEKTIDLNAGITDFSIYLIGQIVVETIDPVEAQRAQNVLPLFSVKVIDPLGNILRTYDNVTSAGSGDRIPVQRQGDFKVNVSNNSPGNTIKVQLLSTDLTKIENRPLEGLGQWLTIISLPVFGLAAWFIVSRLRQSSTISSE